MIEYVLTYVPNGQQVLMIRKNKPDWQAGKLNFPGGKVEEGEDPGRAAARELFEETGLLAFYMPFQGRIVVNDVVVHVYKAICKEVHNFEQKTDEKLELIFHEWLKRRTDLVDYNIVIMDALIRADTPQWELIHRPEGYEIKINSDMQFDKH